MHLISAKQFTSADQLNHFFDVVDNISSPYCPLIKMFGPLAKDKIMAALFYEPSTRTRFSFEAAMHRLGGNVISEGNPQMLSVAKGETLEDTIRTVSNYCDVLVLRHPEKGAAKRAAQVSEVPILNAGDGAGEHPTQALLDLYTIRQNFKLSAWRSRSTDLSILLCGDLLNGRTVHSLVTLLSLYSGIHVIACSPSSLPLPSNLIDLLKDKGATIETHETLEAGLAKKPNIVYMTRLQKERWEPNDQFGERRTGMAAAVQWNDFCLTPKLMEYLDEKALVLHPLPRNEELAGAVDDDPRCVYFSKQVKNGMKVRMGLLYGIFHDKVCYGPAL